MNVRLSSMIIHKLIWRHLSHRDDPDFYRLQADDAVRWIESRGLRITPELTVLDLGCGHGVLGQVFIERGCRVTFADEGRYLIPELANEPFRAIDLDRDDLGILGRYDLVICSNVLEHLRESHRFTASMHVLLNPGGVLYLSWTNWLSPWGGHEFSPFHYLGPRRGHLLYDRWVGKPRKHTPFVNLYPTSIHGMLKSIRANPQVQLQARAPRYYPELAFLLYVPLLREFLAWNCALLLRRKSVESSDPKP